MFLAAPTIAQGRRWCAALLVTAVLGCSGGGDDATPAAPGDVALAASRPGELLSYAQDRLRTRQAQQLPAPGASPGSAPPLVLDAGLAGAPVLRSGTTVQEAGVDEDDLIKSDGGFIYTLDTSGRDAAGQPTTRVQAHRRRADGGIEATASLPLPGDAKAVPVTRGMLLAASARRIAVLSESVTVGTGPDLCAAVADCRGGPTLLPVPAITSSQVHVQLVDAAGGGLGIGQRITLSGRLVGTRLIGNALVVVSTDTPRLAFDALPPDASDAARAAEIAALKTSELLPQISLDGAPPQPLLADTDCYVQVKNASLAIEVTTITVFDLGSPQPAHRSRCIVGGSEALYMSADAVVLATTRQASLGGAPLLRYPLDIRTDLHKFALDAGVPSYRGSGSVAGHLGWEPQRKPYHISEHKGDLRVLSFTGDVGWGSAVDSSVPASPATLTVLREQAGEKALQVVSQLPNTKRPALLGKVGEQIYAVRFLGERAYLVTFRQSDPLYVLDLSDPADPQVAGELLVPGFSNDLYPLANGLLFGVGRDASATGVVGGVKLALFDVANPAQPRVLAQQVFGQRGSMSALDFGPHGVNLFETGTMVRIALPLFLNAGSQLPFQQGLQCIEVDTAARAMKIKQLIAPSDPAPGNDVWAFDLWAQRSLQIGAQIYYLSQGRLSGSDW
jgi:hypothetical protein